MLVNKNTDGGTFSRPVLIDADLKQLSAHTTKLTQVRCVGLIRPFLSEVCVELLPNRVLPPCFLF